MRPENYHSLTSREVMILHNISKRFFSLIALVLITLTLPCEYVLAHDDSIMTNPDTGYVVDIYDEADLLTDAQEAELAASMLNLTKYENVAFLTIDSNPYGSAYSYAYSFYEKYYGSSNGTVLLIDMDNREILIHSGGRIKDIITADYANTITDNIYRYASNEEYDTCAQNAFAQILNVIEGRRIAQPMKYICNALLAMICALLINYFTAKMSSASTKATTGEIASNVKSNFAFRNSKVVHTHTSKTYTPRNDSSSSSGSHHSGGGSFSSSSSSSGHSGSTGSHRF